MRILFLDVDTLRPDHLGCYGYQRQTSPTLDRIASEGTRFENYYCSDAPCLPSRAAMVSGQFGIHTGAVGHGGTAADMLLEGPQRDFRSRYSQSNLWKLCRLAGMRTASISPFAERHSSWWFNAGFNETYNTGLLGEESAEQITPTVMQWLDRNASSDNWMLHINYWDPHTPFRAPPEFGNPFTNDPLPAWMTPEIIQEHNSLPGGHSSRELCMWDSNLKPHLAARHLGEVRNMADYRKMIDGYDCGIRYMDGHIASILKRLEDAGVLEDTAIIVTSDHGENLGELNCYAEHGTADNITHRIPMIIRLPGGRKNQVDTGFHYNVDLLPTLAELWKLPVEPHWDGQSFAPSLAQGKECGRDHLVLSQCCHGAMRSVRFGNWIYIRVYHDFFHLYPEEMLFDLASDPHEQHNLALKRPEICASGARLLLNWHDQMMLTVPSGVDPLRTVLNEGGPFHSKGHLRKYCARLEATGRGQYVGALKNRHPEEKA